MDETERALLVTEIDHLRSIVAEQEQHLESLQNRYAQISVDYDKAQCAIDEFCEKTQWSTDSWKRQSYIANLYRLRSDA